MGDSRSGAATTATRSTPGFASWGAISPGCATRSGSNDNRVSGALDGEFHLTGAYNRPIGFGLMTVRQGIAYGEPFERASASLRLDGTGVRFDGVDVAMAGGSMSGAAFVGWGATYSFNADGRGISVSRLRSLVYRRAPLSGLLEFSAAGSSTFEQPHYDVHFRVADLSIAGENVGQLTGSAAVRANELSGQIEAASARLAITGTGRISLAAKADAELSFRFHDSSLDPYVRLFVPRLSPFTTAVATGSIRIAGELAEVDHLLVDCTIDQIDLRLFDYALRNAGPIRLALDQDRVRIEALQLAGDDTELKVAGSIGLRDQQIALTASGDANLGILQGFFKDVRSSGHAELTAAVDGPLHAPLFSGSATIADGQPSFCPAELARSGERHRPVRRGRHPSR